MQDCKPSKTLAEININSEVAREDSARVDSHEFRSIVVSLIYLAKQTTAPLTFCEAEYLGLVVTDQEAIFVLGLLRELGYNSVSQNHRREQPHLHKACN